MTPDRTFRLGRYTLNFKDAGELLVMESASRRLSKYTQKFYSDRTDAIIRIIGNKPVERICAADLRRSLTECPERSSPMPAFFAGLNKGRVAPSDALRKAKLQFLSDPLLRHPFFWAPTVVFGDSDVLSLPGGQLSRQR
jgi:hypothetical protein